MVNFDVDENLQDNLINNLKDELYEKEIRYSLSITYISFY
jgi:hypothetical protein